MTDRNVQYPSRYKLTLVEGTSDVYELTPAPGEVSAEGTILNKANLLSDNTAQALGLPQADPTVNDALNQLSGKQDPWQLIDLLDNTGAMSGTWTAPDVFEGENYDLGVYEIGGGGSGGAAANSQNDATGGASGYGKNFIINNVAPNMQYPYVIGAGGAPKSPYGNGNAGGTTSFNSVSTDGGEGGEYRSGSGSYNAPLGVNGGQGSDGVSSPIESNRQLFGCSPTIAPASSDGTNGYGGMSQSPRVGQNMFDQEMVTLSAGGWVDYSAGQTIAAMPDGSKGGDGVLNGNGQNATGHGNGGGACRYNNASGSGSDGAIFLYARRRSPIKYQVSITVLDQDSNPVGGVFITGLGVATNDQGVATATLYSKTATFIIDSYTDITGTQLSATLEDGTLNSFTMNVTTVSFLSFTRAQTGSKVTFSPAVKRIDVSAVGGGGAGSYGGSNVNGGHYPGGGGGGGYVTVQQNVDFEAETEYTVTVGNGGAKNTTDKAAGGNGGQSSFLGVVANGGNGGAAVTYYGGAGGTGNGNGGKAASRNGPGAAGGAGTGQYYTSLTETAPAGGGGGGGAYDNSTFDRGMTIAASAGGAPNGGNGGGSQYRLKPTDATAGIVPGGGGGGAAVSYSEGAGWGNRGQAANGANGIVTARVYHSFNLPT